MTKIKNSASEDWDVIETIIKHSIKIFWVLVYLEVTNISGDNK